MQQPYLINICPQLAFFADHGLYDHHTHSPLCSLFMCEERMEYY